MTGLMQDATFDFIFYQHAGILDNMLKNMLSLLLLPILILCSSALEGKAVLLPEGNVKDLAFYDGEKALDSTGTWEFQNGELVCSGSPRGYLILAEAVSDYTLSFEWKWDGDEGGNSGVLVHAVPASSGFRTWPSSIEVQLQSQMAGDIYAIGQLPGFTGEGSVFVAPGVPVTRLDRQTTAENPIGEWNKMEIVASGATLVVKVNGQLVNEIARVKPSAGAIALQSEGAPIRFRKLVLEQ